MDSNPKILSNLERRTLEAVAERIFPKTDSPGAVEIGAVNYIEIALAGDYAALLPLYRSGLRALNQHARAKLGGQFARLDGQRQDEVLKDFESGSVAGFKKAAEFFETVARITANPKLAANWILGEFTRELNSSGKPVSQSLTSAEDLAELIVQVESGKINNNQAKEVFAQMFATGEPAAKVIEEKGYEQISDTSAIEKIVDDVIAANDANVATYRSGNDKLFGFFVGQVMKASQGKANPKVVNDILRSKL